MKTMMAVASATLMALATAAPAFAMDVRFDIQNTGSDTISIVQVDGGDNLMDGEIVPGNSGTVTITGLEQGDCDHTVSVMTENAVEFEAYLDLCELEGIAIDDDGMNAY